MKNHDQIVTEQIAYYRARATEYDEWFLRQGRYDHGEAHSKQWFSEVTAVQNTLANFNPTGKVLEFASGTGWWTEQLVKYADSVTAVDTSPETIAINKAKLQSNKVTYLNADIFSWEPTEKYDVVFFSFWLSHVPPERFDTFWALVRRCLGENGRVFLIDSLYSPDSTAKNQALKAEHDTTVNRQLNDGQTFEIVKLFYTPEGLTSALTRLGWRCDFKASESSFIYGSCHAL